MSKRKLTENFIKQATEIHGNNIVILSEYIIKN